MMCCYRQFKNINRHAMWWSFWRKRHRFTLICNQRQGNNQGSVSSTQRRYTQCQVNITSLAKFFHSYKKFFFLHTFQLQYISKNNILISLNNKFQVLHNFNPNVIQELLKFISIFNSKKIDKCLHPIPPEVFVRCCLYLIWIVFALLLPCLI